MWNIKKMDDSYTVSRASSESFNLNTLIENKRKELCGLKPVKITSLKNKLELLNKQLDELKNPDQTNQRYACKKEIKMIEDSMKESEQGEARTIFENNITPFIYAEQKQQNLNDMEKLLGKYDNIGLKYSQNSEIVHEYLKNIEGKISEAMDSNENHSFVNSQCPECHVEMLYDSQDSKLICKLCGRTQIFVDATSDSIAYGDEVEITAFAYQPLTHFKEMLIYFQGKENTYVPDDVIRELTVKLYEMGVRDSKTITVSIIFDMLKKLKDKRKYYKHKTQILYKITGKKPPRLSAQQEKAYIDQFRKIYPLYVKYCPKGRNNFFSYNYILHRITEYFGYKEYLEFFPLLKGIDKLKKHDIIFKKICHDLNWDESCFNFIR